MLYALGNRFCKEIHVPSLILKIVSTYITPILEYASIVWDQNRIVSEGRIEKVLHYGTRMALQLPYRSDHPNYVAFDVRRRTCKVLTYRERRVINSIVVIIKISRGLLITQLSDRIVNCMRPPGRFTRHPNIFNLSLGTFATKSPIRIAMENTNDHRRIFEITDSLDVIRSKLTAHYRDTDLR